MRLGSYKFFSGETGYKFLSLTKIQVISLTSTGICVTKMVYSIIRWSQCKNLYGSTILSGDSGFALWPLICIIWIDHVNIMCIQSKIAMIQIISAWLICIILFVHRMCIQSKMPMIQIISAWLICIIWFDHVHRMCMHPKIKKIQIISAWLICIGLFNHVHRMCIQSKMASIQIISAWLICIGLFNHVHRMCIQSKMASIQIISAWLYLLHNTNSRPHIWCVYPTSGTSTSLFDLGHE